MINLQQERAKAAFKSINEVFLENGKKRTIEKVTANFVTGIPNMILSNGLGQSLAFLLSKKNKDEKEKEYKVFKILKYRICEVFKEEEFKEVDDYSFVKSFSSISDQKKYLKIQHECLKFSEWLKRYAKAFAEKDE